MYLLDHRGLDIFARDLDSLAFKKCRAKCRCRVRSFSLELAGQPEAGLVMYIDTHYRN